MLSRSPTQMTILRYLAAVLDFLGRLETLFGDTCLSDQKSASPSALPSSFPANGPVAMPFWSAWATRTAFSALMEVLADSRRDDVRTARWHLQWCNKNTLRVHRQISAKAHSRSPHQKARDSTQQEYREKKKILCQYVYRENSLRCRLRITM